MTYKIDDQEWENRTLCSDGNCIGVIGKDGRCKECGKAHNGNTDTVETDHGPDDSVKEPEITQDTSDEDAAESSYGEEADDVEEENLDWENRRLCSDGNCIGVIGKNGRCKECGKPYKGELNLG